MEILKWCVAVLAGAAGGFAAAKILRKKENHVVVKMWAKEAYKSNELMAIPMRRVGDIFVGGTPCAVDAFSVERISADEFVARIEGARKRHEAEMVRPPEPEAEEEVATEEVATEEVVTEAEEEVAV